MRFLRPLQCLIIEKVGSMDAWKAGYMKKMMRPMQIRIEEDLYQILKVWAATEDKTPNTLIREMAESKAEEVRDLVADLLER